MSHECPVCLGRADLLDTVDLSKNCEEVHGRFLPISGTSIGYELCDECGYCFAPDMYTWLPARFAELIYNEAYILVDPDYADTRPRSNAEYLLNTVGEGARNIRHLDFGGGSGLLSGVLRTAGWNSTSYDPFAGDDVDPVSLGKFDFITAFEVFEHTPDPRKLVANLSGLLNANGVIIFSTLLSDGEIARGKPLTWWYASPRNGHISLYSRKSLGYLMAHGEFNLHNYSANLHACWRVVPAWATRFLPDPQAISVGASMNPEAPAPHSRRGLASLIGAFFGRRSKTAGADSDGRSAENARLKALTTAADAACAEGRLDDAQRDYETVLLSDPRDLYVIYRLAQLLQQRQAFAQAAEICDHGLAIQQDQVGLLSLRAAIASDLGNHAQAVDIYQRVGELVPNFKGLDASLANEYSFLGRGKDAIAAFDRAIAQDPDAPSLQSDRLFVLNYFKLLDRQLLFEEHRKWGARQEARLAPLRLPSPNSRDPDRRLRMGYVSADLRHHSVAFFIEGIIRNHERSQFEIHCFDASPYAEDNVTERLRSYVDRWHRVAALIDDRLVTLIRAEKIDILIDLSGHTAHNRLLAFAYKPAPVQVGWFGYMNTTGLSTIDYRLTDGYMDPVGESERYYTEKLFRIESMACFTPHPESPPVSALPALAADVFTFASVNQWTKITDEVKDLWASILKATPASRLLIVVRGAEVPAVRDSVVAQFVERGAKASQIVVYPTQPILAFLTLYAQIDVALDPFPYGGGTSSLHTIWMGVPIVTLEGDSEMSRATAGIERAVGLQDWVARDASGFRDIALKAAANRESLAALRSELRARMQASSLIDAVSVTRNVEQAFRAMWHTYCKTSEP